MIKKSLIEWAKKLKKYCEHTNCKVCIFQKGHICAIAGNPSVWELEKEEVENESENN